MVAAMSDSMPARSKLLFSSQGSPMMFCCDMGHPPSSTEASPAKKGLGLNGQAVNALEPEEWSVWNCDWG